MPEPPEITSAELLMALDQYEAQGMPPHLVERLRGMVRAEPALRAWRDAAVGAMEGIVRSGLAGRPDWSIAAFVSLLSVARGEDPEETMRQLGPGW
jgi:hypothetical protein